MLDLPGISVPKPPNPVSFAINPAGSILGQGVGSIGGSILSAIGWAIARGLADACKKVTDGLLGFLGTSTGLNLHAGWWASARTQQVLHAVGLLAAVLMVGFVLLALIQGLLVGEPGLMLRAALVEVPVSIFGIVVLVAITELLVGVTDAASAMVLAGAPGDLGHFLSGFGSAATVTSGGLAAAVLLVVFLLGAFLVWVELVVRASLIYLLIAFAPLCLAARVWPAAKGVSRRLCELGVALIVAKFGIALALGLGAAALAGGGPNPPGGAGAAAGAGLGGLLAGATLMLLAAFMPFVVLRLLPILETAVVAQGISRAPLRAAQTGLQAGYYTQGLSRLTGGRTPNLAPPGGPDGDGPPPGGRPEPGGPSPAGPAGRPPGPAGPAGAAHGRPVPTAGAGGDPGPTGQAAPAVPVGVAARTAAARDRAAPTAGTVTPPPRPVAPARRERS